MDLIEVPYIYKVVKVFPPDKDEYISRCALQGRIWDSWMLPWLVQFSKSGGTFVDVGANIGLDTVLFSCFSKVIAFEPVHHDILKYNSENCIYPVTVHDCALSDHEGTADIYLYRGNNCGAPSLDVKHDGGDSIQVNLKRLDDVINDERVSFIKIDVEGHEMKVLEGAKNIIKKWRPALCVETFDHLDELQSFASEFGYMIRECPEHNYVLVAI
jgi:FkbM family methyltransferase